MRHKSFLNICKSLLGGALLTLLATGCNSEDFTPSTNDVKDAVVLTGGTTISVDAQSTTRAANDTWAADDLIGVTMLSTSTPATPIYTNNQYKAVAAGSGDVAFNPESEGQKMYYPINGSEVTFKAYYPYTGLTDYPNYPVNVSGQADIAALDLMTAVHKNKDGSTANSKDNKEAHLVFHHRLTLVTVNLLTEAGSPIDLGGSQLAIKGMKTTGSYNLLTDVLTPDAASVNAINIPLSNNTGQAILLPREAGEGVTFEVTTDNGGVYTAKMDAGLELKGGTKYTFNLTLKTTPALITASIEDWTDGPVRNYDVVHVVTAQGESEGFKEDDVLRLYAKDNGDADYSYTKGGSFIFKGSKWTIENPVYWENFTGPVDFRATSVYAEKLNTTQMDDYLVGETTGVDLYKGVHLEMKHAGTKVTVKLSSSDGIYTAADLQGATVTLPDYLNTGSLNETTGAYTVGTGKGDITPEAPGATERVAIFPAQTIAANDVLVKVEINGHVYEVKDASAFTYEAGQHHEIRLNIQKSGVMLTTKLVDWVDGDDHEAEVRIGIPTLGTNENIPDGSQLRLFTEETVGAERVEVPGYFTYNATSDSWSYSVASNPLFWEVLPSTGNIYASIENAAINGTEGYNQSKDYIVATPIENKGGKGNTAVHFEMSHAVSQVNVTLRTSDTYTADQLKTAEITLPGYTIGGSLNKGVYVQGANTGDIRLDNPNNNEISTRSYLQAQTIPAGEIVARVKIGTRVYDVTYNHDVEYNAGEITHLFITIKGSEVLVSVKVTDWIDQTPVELTYSFNESPTSVEGFEVGDKITFHRLDNNGDVIESKVYVVQEVEGKKKLVAEDGTPWYRDDFATGDKIVAVYPDGTRTGIASGEKTFDVDLNGKTDPSDRTNDILVASDGEIEDKDANVDLTFDHILSKVTVNIIPGEGFAPNEISGGSPVVELVEFMQKGTVDISNGTVSNLSDNQTFEPTQLTTPNSGAELSYQALILPQTKGSTGNKVMLVKITLGGVVYEAQYEGVFTFEPGKNHVLDITLAKTALKLSAAIAEWELGTKGDITID